MFCTFWTFHSSDKLNYSVSCILAIETSTEVCSVALGQDGDTIFEKVCEETNAHTRHLATFVDEALSFANSHAIPLDAVAITEGPGSYTGLRIGELMALHLRMWIWKVRSSASTNPFSDWRERMLSPHRKRPRACARSIFLHFSRRIYWIIKKAFLILSRWTGWYIYCEIDISLLSGGDKDWWHDCRSV